ncbi:2251_t:CDS:2 [Ambispora gerdemannii]|uniref:2251_t:CDS:1 n=1 Tax=Ambispora gerdemannii TaxID=144530 RepID=A0A9N8Z6U9_9GLOM|nr:2251_t:CDS:2 [Ambispora gerdemannii]
MEEDLFLVLEYSMKSSAYSKVPGTGEELNHMISAVRRSKISFNFGQHYFIFLARTLDIIIRHPSWQTNKTSLVPCQFHDSSMTCRPKLIADLHRITAPPDTIFFTPFQQSKTARMAPIPTQLLNNKKVTEPDKHMQ